MVGKEQSSALCLDVYSDLRAFSDIDSKTYNLLCDLQRDI